MHALEALGGLGGLVALVTAVIILGRGIFRQVNATEDNTTALKEMTGRVESLFQLYSSHETRIAILEDRIQREHPRR